VIDEVLEVLLDSKRACWEADPEPQRIDQHSLVLVLEVLMDGKKRAWETGEQSVEDQSPRMYGNGKHRH
jgi:hypothetical protein